MASLRSEPGQEPVPVSTAEYPSWVLALMSDRQVTALPPPMLWAKVVQNVDVDRGKLVDKPVLDAAAVEVASALYLNGNKAGLPFAIGMRLLAAQLRRSRDYVAAGVDLLHRTGFLSIEGGGGRRFRYTLTLPTVSPVDHVESVSPVDHVGTSADAPSAPPTAPSASSATTVGSAGHVERKSAQTATREPGEGQEVEAKILAALVEAAPASKREQVERRGAEIRRALDKLDGLRLSPGRIVQALTERELASAGDAGAVLLARIDVLARDAPGRPVDDPQRRLDGARAVGRNLAALDERDVRGSLEARYPDDPAAVAAGVEAWHDAQPREAIA